MQTKNVFFAERPDKVVITESGGSALVEFPIDVEEVETEESTQYLAKKVYALRTKATARLKERILDNFKEWLEKAKEGEPIKLPVVDRLTDVEAALVELAELYAEQDDALVELAGMMED